MKLVIKGVLTLIVVQKENSYYTFLLSRTTKEKIYIRRLEVSKKLLHTSAASLMLCLGLGLVGVFGFLKSNNSFILAENSENPSGSLSEVKSVSSIDNKAFLGDQPIDYSKPQTFDQYVLNSGGPSDFQLTATATSGEEKEIEKRLRHIEANSRPEFLPTIWAHLGKINNEFGFRRNPFGGRSYEFHQGMDIDGDKGDLVVAPANGKIIKAGWQGGYGRLIEIDHGNGLSTRYGHLSVLKLKEGDSVQRGQLIGLVGSTGRSTGPHLHYELRLNKKAINPRRFLPPEPLQIR